ncbi:TRAP transporter large permease [Bacillus sp. Marseille-P3661]|uniref:TRAP transporter large permease n=1 Tax=Bacillus sp. Marseille-P3661 TaxID=1936234 RepID=UPI000C834C90|nr:TRAP transporter large permease [Bacillus sp. Marseille-P3661]
MSELVIGLIGIVVFFGLMALRMPIAFTMAIVGYLGLCVLTSPSAALGVVAKEIYANFSSYTLSVVPMFILMGFVAFYSGIGTSLYNFAYKLVGHFPGGLAIATQVTCGLFGAVSGSNTATAATIGAISIPEMKKYNYDDSLSTGSVAAGGALGILIPPSVIFILYGIATEQSIGKLFIAGILPGILLMLLYILAIVIIVVRNPKLGPPGPKSSWSERIHALRGGLFEALAVFVISLGGLYIGLFTPTEAGAVGAAAILGISLIQKRIDWKGIKNSLVDTTRITAMIMLLLAGAIIFGRFMTLSQIPTELASWASSFPYPPFIVMGLILIIYLILGFFIDALALILLTIPVFYPVAVTTLGYDPIWFGIIITLVVAAGIITPPVGVNVYIIKGVAKDVPLETIFKGIWPFFFALIICIIILMLVPEIVTFLPEVLG